MYCWPSGFQHKHGCVLRHIHYSINQPLCLTISFRPFAATLSYCPWAYWRTGGASGCKACSRHSRVLFCCWRHGSPVVTQYASVALKERNLPCASFWDLRNPLFDIQPPYKLYSYTSSSSPSTRPSPLHQQPTAAIRRGPTVHVYSRRWGITVHGRLGLGRDVARYGLWDRHRVFREWSWRDITWDDPRGKHAAYAESRMWVRWSFYLQGVLTRKLSQRML